MDQHVFVVGCGSIGQRHLRNLHALGVTDLWAFDNDPDRLAAVAREQSVTTCGSLEAGLATRPRAVLICTPPRLHAEQATLALSFGAHVFVEKPIAHTLDAADALLSEAAARGRLVYVGYNSRFHRGLLLLEEQLESGVIGRPLVFRAEFGSYLPNWRPNQDYRSGYNTSAAEGGGVILDISHEIDYVRWLGGEVRAVSCTAEHVGPLQMDVEDVALITMRLASGALAEIHLDSLQHAYTRTCKVVGEEGTLVWDAYEGVRCFTTAEKTWQSLPMAPDANEMYVEEMRHFLDCLAGHARPIVDGATGRRVLEIALAAKRSAAEGHEVAL